MNIYVVNKKRTPLPYHSSHIHVAPSNNQVRSQSLRGLKLTSVYSWFMNVGISVEKNQTVENMARLLTELRNHHIRKRVNHPPWTASMLPISISRCCRLRVSI